MGYLARRLVFDARRPRRNSGIVSAGRAGLVNTEGLFVEIISGSRVCTGAAAHAYITKLAAATFSLQVAHVAELIEYE